MDILLRMGFPMDRAEKALTCTGDVSVPAAIDWILSHKDDPLLDVQDQREYLVYLCPSGPLLEKIEEFLNKTVETSGRNGAHLHMPHITMCHASLSAFIFCNDGPGAHL
ncbi:putative Ubiquitin-associated and SH3 domain-containing protein B [Hypsibius exemplaris]|uniref:Ubiquitin-associated and SH3 domain-containing protein B n=1 Tax=Hypsibius exemplaris TaxID=2072580 RepID=A0A1W0WBI6_HYPEX|nr:putative Ubiquitin-associated and SH3 domain-containing protein B [Hypsibius exemplaris]